VREQVAINALVAARLGGSWEPHWRTAEYLVTFTRPPQPPREVVYEPSSDEYVVTLGRTTRNHRATIDLRSESPHGMVAAGTGAGKSSTLRILIVHARAHGWLVDIIDPKRRSFVELEGVPGIRIHTDITSMVTAFEEFYLSLDGANAAVHEGRLAP